ncbi:hypothetical protein QU41_01080, partial [Bradyrhizobium elkanii]
MFQALSRLSITEAARHAVTQLAVIALTLGLTTGGAFAAAGDAGGTTRFDLALLVRQRDLDAVDLGGVGVDDRNRRIHRLVEIGGAPIA